MLSGLIIAAALTAFLAGLTGAFSPCGFSMVDTLGSALGDTRRGITQIACTTFTLGALAGGVLTFCGLAWAGSLLGDSGIAKGLGAAIALTGAVLDWRGVKIAPQIRRQVPERWRWTLPLPLTAVLYGLLLGLGFTTFVLSFALWALAGVTLALGSVSMGLATGLAFGIGRALPILWMAPGLRRDPAAERQLEVLATEPRLWLGLRRLGAIGLLLCAFWISAGVAQALVLPRGADPVASGRQLAWQKLGGSGMLRRSSGEVRALPGSDPALGGLLIAWRNGSQVTVADAHSLSPKLTLSVAGVNALAVSNGWLAYRRRSGGGASETLIAARLSNPSQRRHVLGPRPVGEIGRPALEGGRLVFTIDTPQQSRIEAVSLAQGSRHLLRQSRRGAALFNPSVLGDRLLYERVDACAQKLLLGTLHSSYRDRVLVSLPSTVRRDPGYQPGYENAWNAASNCPNRRRGRGGTRQLGPTALSGTLAYMTETLPSPARARIRTVRR